MNEGDGVLEFSRDFCGAGEGLTSCLAVAYDAAFEEEKAEERGDEGENTRGDEN